MASTRTRREFLRQTAAGGAGFWMAGRRIHAETRPANEKLHIGIIGVGGRGEGNLDGVAGEAIVALCDVDQRQAGKARERFPRATFYVDFRHLLDHNDIDAVVVSTPDHTHAPATAAALRAGKHVYCEKPLTHSVYEAREVTKLAQKAGLATQMGTQIHAGPNYRRAVELIQSGAIGPVRDVHVWVGRQWGGHDRPKETPPIPEGLDYDLWLGPAPYRPYHPEHLPGTWRGWWDFGGGTLGDMACHYMDLVFWALDLKAPLTVEAEGPPVHPESCPPTLTVRYEYPASPTRPPVKVTWYHGGLLPPHFAEGKLPQWGDGILFVGDKGMLLADYDHRKLLPQEDFADYVPPEPFIPNSIGHHREWIEACKTGRPTTCHFGYAGPLTEAVLLGNVAYRTGAKLEWNVKELTAANAPQADRFIRPPYRKGWVL